MISQRDAFFSRIYELAKVDRNIIIISADMGAPTLDCIREELPDQFINVGIAEQNMITLAAGLALSGKHVFCYAIAPFITIRCLDQIRVCCGQMDLPIVLVGVGAGLSYKDSGPTHHAIEDMAIMRAIPGLTIYNVRDAAMAREIAKVSHCTTGPLYIRLDRDIFPDIHSTGGGFDGIYLWKPHQRFYILATGSMVHKALEIANKLDVGLIEIYRYPINDHLIELIGDRERLLTLEENFLAGGLGSAILETLNDHRLNISVKRLGLSTSNGYQYQYGRRDEIRKHYGLDNETIERETREWFSLS
tara:strand:+ start:2499 stop:3410 length:912 start_codon:yes stop_codon:yes gene_type:complete